MEKISVIIPVYNCGKYLKETLNSVINQAYKNFEVICINDCSTDNSSQILQEFARKDERIKIINNEQNLGAALTRNVGIDNAKGKYIYFLDGDDFIDEKYLECMVEKFEKADCDIILNLSVIYKNNDSETSYIHPYIPDIDKEGEYLDKYSTIHDAPCFIWARMYKRDFLNKHNLRFLNTYTDDVAFNIITTMHTEKTFIFYGKNYYYITNNTGMICQTEKSNSKDLNHMKAYSEVYDFLKERNRFDNKLKLFRVYPFMKVDTEEKFDFYKKFFEKIEENFKKNENIYNEMEKYFAYSLLNSASYDEYLKNYNKVVTIGFLRRKK